MYACSSNSLKLRQCTSSTQSSLCVSYPPLFVGNEATLQAEIEEVLHEISPYWLWGALVVRSEPPLPLEDLEAMVQVYPLPMEEAWVLRMPGEIEPPEMVWTAVFDGDEASETSSIIVRLSDFRSGRVLPMKSPSQVPVCKIERRKALHDVVLMLRLKARLPSRDEPSLMQMRQQMEIAGLRELHLVSPHPALTLSALSHLLAYAVELKERD